ncbi:MAG: hypothetical protein DWQ19_11045 [Crenarchaeota archaeon]|nr:MAG: hypothetical protein DWQ19_11045 [Thermoproteota archaeon]
MSNYWLRDPEHNLLLKKDWEMEFSKLHNDFYAFVIDSLFEHEKDFVEKAITFLEEKTGNSAWYTYSWRREKNSPRTQQFKFGANLLDKEWG